MPTDKKPAVLTKSEVNPAEKANTGKTKTPDPGKTGESSKQSQPEQQHKEHKSGGISSSDSKGTPKHKRNLSAIENLLGETLVNAQGHKTNPSNLVKTDKVLGLYFGAKWCPPCRTLYPNLMLLYEEVRKTNTNRFDIVFISSDHSMESFREYLSKMPWWAVDFSNDEKREDLAVKYNIRGIPVFVLIDANTLQVVNKDGRYFASSDPKGQNFPWKDTPVPEVFNDTLKKLMAVAKEQQWGIKDGTAVDVRLTLDGNSSFAMPSLPKPTTTTGSTSEAGKNKTTHNETSKEKTTPNETNKMPTTPNETNKSKTSTTPKK